ncbi:MAG: hypothetical protein H7831_01150 [Magnetococcus sp. WYHC-3]
MTQPHPSRDGAVSLWCSKPGDGASYTLPQEPLWPYHDGSWGLMRTRKCLLVFDKIVLL